MSTRISDYINRTAVKIISNLSTVKFDTNDVISENELEELNNFPSSHYKLFAGFVKTFNPLFVIIFSNKFDPLTEISIKKYLRSEGKTISFLADSGYVCDTTLQTSGKNLVKIKEDFASDDSFEKYYDILKFADLIFIDDDNPERVERAISKLKVLEYLRNPLLILKNTNEKLIYECWKNSEFAGMSLTSFSETKGTALIEIKHQKSCPDELEETDRHKKLHIGCGEKKIPGFINVDVRPTEATDLVHNCIEFEDFPEKYFDVIYSHAFFEHLSASDELKCLKNIKRILNQNGEVIFLGIPDFEIISKCYTEGTAGVTTSKFDLLQVYRYTHGAPEQGGEDWWFEQLHKSVFDASRLESLLELSEYQSYVIFRYNFRDENIKLNLGFIASLSRGTMENETPDSILTKINSITSDIQNNQIEILIRK